MIEPEKFICPCCAAKVSQCSGDLVILNYDREQRIDNNTIFVTQSFRYKHQSGGCLKEFNHVRSFVDE